MQTKRRAIISSQNRVRGSGLAAARQAEGDYCKDPQMQINQGERQPACCLKASRDDRFWSLTMSDANNDFVKNPISRYIVNDRSELTQNPDGSIDIYIQNTAPDGHESNWLPAPTGKFILWLRVYMPGAAILDGSYQVPPVVNMK